MKLFVRSLFVFILATSPLAAATVTWTGTASNLWSNPANWAGGAVPIAGDDLVFPSTAANKTNTNDLAAGIVFNSISVTGTTAYNISGNAIGLAGGGISVNGGNATQLTFSSITLNAPQTWSASTSGSATTFGPTNVNGQTLTFNTAQSLIVQSMSGGGAIIKNGTNVVSILASTYTGTITVNGSQVNLDGGTAGNVTVTTDGNFVMGGTSVGTISITGGGTLAIGTTFNSGSVSFAGIPSKAATLTVSLSPTVTNIDNVTGSVSLGNARLGLLGGSGIAAGTIITLFNNDGADAVSGTFLGLPEGAVINSGGVSFQVSYVGGTGNDVTLTALASAAPATTTTVISSINPSLPGQSVTFTATVSSGSGTPTGNVSFFDGGTLLTTVALNPSGQATFTTTALASGPHQINVVFAGSASFASSSGAVRQFVGLPSTTALTSIPNPSLVGQNVTFTATVTGSGTPTGTVDFFDGSTFLGTSPVVSGQAVLTTSALAAGSHPVTAFFSGDSTFTPSTSPVDNQIVNAPVPLFGGAGLALVALALIAIALTIMRR